MSQKFKGYLALFITSFVWGSTWVVSKMTVKEVPGLEVAYLRQMMAGLCLVGFFLLFKKEKLPTKKQWLWLLLMAVLMFVFANGLSTMGVEYISSGLGALIGALYPLSVQLIEFLFFKKRNLSATIVVGLILGVVGIGIVFYENSQVHPDPKFLLGVGLSVFAMLGWSVGSVFLSRNKENLNPYYGVGWQMILSSIMLFGLVHLLGIHVPETQISLHSWLNVVYLFLFGSIIAFLAFIYSIKVLPTHIATLYAYVNPLVAMFIASIFINEKITFHIVAGSIVTLLGIFLVNFGNKKLQKISELKEPHL